MSNVKNLVTDLNIQATEYTAETTTHRIKTICYKGKWYVVRWALGMAEIPPNKEILTPNGWRGVLAEHKTALTFNDALEAILAAAKYDDDTH